MRLRERKEKEKRPECREERLKMRLGSGEKEKKTLEPKQMRESAGNLTIETYKDGWQRIQWVPLLSALT